MRFEKKKLKKTHVSKCAKAEQQTASFLSIRETTRRAGRGFQNLAEEIPFPLSIIGTG